MRAQKRKRLEKAGWKLGSAKQVLGLTAGEEAVVDLKLVLARDVREERSKRKLTQEQLGRMLGSSQSRVAKMEAGDPSVSIDLLVRSLLRMGASRRDVARGLARPAPSAPRPEPAGPYPPPDIVSPLSLDPQPHAPPTP